MKKYFFFLCVVFLLITANTVSGKVREPVVMKPIVYQGIRYVTDYINVDYGPKISGGYVEAWDVKTNKQLWRTRVYKTKKYFPNLESDVQEIFITAFELKNRKLIVKTNKNVYQINGHIIKQMGEFSYRVDLITGKAHRVK